MRALLIVNPYASGVTEQRARAVELALAPLGQIATVLTERRGHAIELARAAVADTIVVYSGDGVFNEVLNGADGKVALGFIPGGGTNVLPRALGLPSDPVAAARAIAAGKTRRISLGRVNGRRFGFNAGIGIDAEIVRRIEAKRPELGRRPSDLGVAVTLARVIAGRRFRFEPALEIKGLGRAALVVVANADPYTYAGPLAIHFTPQAHFELGLDLVAPQRIGPGTVAGLLAHVATGARLGGRRYLRGHDLDRIEVTCDVPLPLQADGEDLGDVREAVFEAERDAVSVLVA